MCLQSDELSTHDDFRQKYQKRLSFVFTGYNDTFQRPNDTRMRIPQAFIWDRPPIQNTAVDFILVRGNDFDVTSNPDILHPGGLQDLPPGGPIFALKVAGSKRKSARHGITNYHLAVQNHLESKGPLATRTDRPRAWEQVCEI